MENFIEQIKNLSENHNPSGNKEVPDPKDYEALNKLFEITEVGIDKFNENNSFPIKLHRLHADLMPLFFNFQSDSSGFIIKTENKFIFVMQSVNNNIFIYGLTSKDGADIRQSMTRAVQLFKLEYKDNNGIKLYDSTNREIDPEEVILQVISWGLS
ncbi:MAG: hypothetical protein ACR2NW_00550 [Thermodesulfobacteriota bacterium]